MLETTTFFKNIKVVELASVLAGPSVGMFFSELGATVIKIENKSMGGDVTRSWKLPSENPEDPKSAYYHSVNFGKRVVMLDLSKESEQFKAIELIRQADIVVANYKKGSAEKLGMGYDQLKQIKPDLIYGSISAYGIDDPRPGFDAAIQAETAWMSMNGQADSPPTKMPVALVDVLAGHQLKQGILVALIHKMQTGEGSHVDVSLYDASIAALNNQASNYLNTGEVPSRKGNAHPNIAPYGDTVLSQDNQWLMLAIGNDRQFADLCDMLDVRELAHDPLYATNTKRVKNRSKLLGHLNGHFGKMDSQSIMDLAMEHKLPISMVHDMKQLFEDPDAQNMILREKEPNGSDSLRVKTVIFKTIQSP